MADDKIKIDWDDLNQPEVEARVEQERRFRVAAAHYERNQQATPEAESGTGRRVYGTVAPALAMSGERASNLRSTIAYMPISGLAASIVAWVCVEVLCGSNSVLGDVGGPLLQAALFFGIVGMLLGSFLGAAEDVVSGAYGKASRAALVGALAGASGGACAGVFAQHLYGVASRSQETVIMVLDTSGSMDGAPLREVMRSSKEFLSEVSAKDDVRVGLVTFSNDARVLCQPSDDMSLLSTGIDRMSAEGATNMAAGLRQALSLLRDTRGRASILLFSDGQPTALPSGTLEDLVVQELAKRGLSLAQVQSLSEEKQAEIADSIRSEFEQKYVIQPQQEAQQAADTIRQEGVRIIAVGTAEADRSFLTSVAGDAEHVLYAERGDISEAFAAAAAILFRSTGQAQNREGLAVHCGVRALGWGCVGLILGLVQGAAIRSKKKARNGALGGLIGGLVGGALFDPINMLVATDYLSRMVALCVIGAATGVFIGLVEAVLKDAWLLVTSGPLTGKQFVIYRNPTILGSAPKADIYLFKDPGVEPQHAALYVGPGWYELADCGTPQGTFVNGRRIERQRLKNGDNIQIGQYAFGYAEKRRSGVQT